MHYKINELKYADQIKVGLEFSHYSQINKQKYFYKIIEINYSNSPYSNDWITIQDLERRCTFEVEPEWFNQRKIKFMSLA